tara:strand:- start:451 stop:1314 length:864 start_codon:yes stop_codon:yes gene_type:complete
MNFDSPTALPPNNIITVIVGLIILLCISLLSFKLYVDNNFKSGITLTFGETLKNIFRKLTSFDTPNDPPVLNPKCKPKKPKKPKAKKPKNPKCPPKAPVRRPLLKAKCSTSTGTDEVYNLDNNEFTYDQAFLACKALDSKLATYDQIQKAHKKGANWCNYGWSAGGLALFPIQERYWDKLQRGGNAKKDSCGKPGINGGFFADKSLKFGVNCYGPKPKPDKSKIVYVDDDCGEAKLLEDYKKDIENGTIALRPFSKNKWSKYSQRESNYILTPKIEEDILMEKGLSN